MRPASEVAYHSGSDCIEDGRAVCPVDLDRDGRLDLVIANYRAPAMILRNQPVEGDARHWLAVRLVARGKNRDALGARIYLEAGGRRQRRDVTTSAGYLAGQTPEQFFGLGETTHVDKVEVVWPSGRRSTWESLPIDHHHQLVEE